MDPVNVPAKFEVRSFTRFHLFSQIFNGLFNVNMHTKFEVRSFTRSWDNRGYSKKFGRPWIRPRSLFSLICHGLVFGWTLWMNQPNLQSIALAVLETIAIAVLGWAANPNLGEWEAVGGRGWYSSRAFVNSYRLSIVTFRLSLRVSELLPLLCSCTPLFPTPPQVSPKFSHVPVGLGGWPWATKSESVGLIDRAISFKDFQPMWSWSTNVADKRTDDMQSQYCAMR